MGQSFCLYWNLGTKIYEMQVLTIYSLSSIAAIIFTLSLTINLNLTQNYTHPTNWPKR